MQVVVHALESNEISNCLNRATQREAPGISLFVIFRLWASGAKRLRLLDMRLSRAVGLSLVGIRNVSWARTRNIYQ